MFAVAQMKMPSLDDSATMTTIGTMMVLSLLAADFTDALAWIADQAGA